MIRTRRNGLFGTGLLAMLGAVAMVAPAAASAKPVNGVIPQEIRDEFGGCPTHAQMQEAGLSYLFCIHLTGYDGELKLGDVVTDIDDPIEILAGIGLRQGGSGVGIVLGGSGAGGSSGDGAGPSGQPGFAPVKVSGGILGIPELDPLIDNEPLGLLRLTAQPTIGDIDAQVEDGFFGHLNRITLPLSIELNNLLFGDDCRIGTPEDPFVLNLTTGETVPPDGVEPISGQAPQRTPVQEWWNYPDTSTVSSGMAPGARSVDNAFDVPGARNCDLLPEQVHEGVEGLSEALEDALGADLPTNELLGRDAGLFDPLINEVAGLPSPAGNNHAMISVDTSYAHANLVRIIHEDIDPLWTLNPGSVEFGGVEIGETVTQAIEVGNPTSDPMAFIVAFFLDNQGDFSLEQNGCEGRTIQPGESCELVFGFAPTSVGTKPQALFVQGIDGVTGPIREHVNIVLNGSGIALSASEVSFDDTQVGHISPVEVARFENGTDRSYAVSQAATLSGNSANQYRIVEDHCNGRDLGPGDECEVELAFSPSSAGPKNNASVDLRGGGQVVGSAALRGQGVAPLSGSPEALEFGELHSGGSSEPQTVGVENTGTLPAVVEGIAFDIPARAGSWQVDSDDCVGRTIQPAERCDLIVAFSPDSTGNKGTTVNLLGPDQVVLGGVSLAGSGLAALAAEPSGLSFGAVVVGASSAPQVVTFENVALEARLLGGVELTGTASRFASWQLDDSDCTDRSLEPGQACQVDVVLAPNSTGTKNVTMRVAGAGGAVLGTATLSGTGTNP